MAKTAKSTTEASIDVRKIVVDDKLYPRAELREDVVDDYAQPMQDGTVLPPIVVFQDRSAYHLADGRHRLEATRRIKGKQIPAEVHEGSARDAMLYAVGANAKHGLRRSDADKRKAVQLLLDDLEWCEWSVNELAEACRHPANQGESPRKLGRP